VLHVAVLCKAKLSIYRYAVLFVELNIGVNRDPLDGLVDNLSSGGLALSATCYCQPDERKTEKGFRKGKGPGQNLGPGIKFNLVDNVEIVFWLHSLNDCLPKIMRMTLVLKRELATGGKNEQLARG
jgi:hypothetical protein